MHWITIHWFPVQANKIMEDMKMKNIELWLTENGFTFEKGVLEENKRYIMVDTNYEGMYAPKETYQKIAQIENKIKHFKSVKGESRGSRTGYLIYEA
jgi:hypothetical protein